MCIDRLDEVIAAICVHMHTTSAPGGAVSYSPMAGHALLGEIVRRAHGGNQHRRNRDAGVDGDPRHHFLDGGELVTLVEKAQLQRPAHLVDDLQVRRHAGPAVQMEVDHQRSQPCHQAFI